MQNNIFLIMLLVSRFVEPPLLKSIYRGTDLPKQTKQFVEPPLLKSIYRATVFRNYPQ